ncbi:plant self-incompatibility S1 [Artemisia annua]|uniref:S-protein homolog n=1 Tax=Artemisia annua TaxID=35608 RepID=A0A2U1N5L3_ARTAN|nr:plant self-incompatibility S1 [Artemisia annua]
MKTLIFVFLCLVFTTNTSSIAKISTPNAKSKCWLGHWSVYIYNAMIDPITVHVKSGDDDLGVHTLAFFDNENWSFCENFWGNTLFYAYFNWNGTRTASFDVWKYDFFKYCSGSLVNPQRRCVWLVRHDGFYLGEDLTPFPNGWHKMHDWS